MSYNKTGDPPEPPVSQIKIQRMNHKCKSLLYFRIIQYCKYTKANHKTKGRAAIITVLPQYLAFPDHNVEGIKLKLFGDICVVLLRFHAVLIEDTSFERYGSGCPVVRSHRVGEADDQIKLSNVHKRPVCASEGLLGGVVHRDACRIGQISESP